MYQYFSCVVVLRLVVILCLSFFPFRFLLAQPSQNGIHRFNRAQQQSTKPSKNGNSGKDNLITIPLAPEPIGVTIDPSKKRIYVANKTGISVIDADTYKIIDTILIQPQYKLRAIAVNTTTHRIYVADYQGGIVYVINGETNEVIKPIKVADLPGSIAINPKKNRIYVSGNNAISVIDGETNGTITQIPSKPGLGGIAVDPDTSLIYASNRIYKTLLIISENTYKVLSTIAIAKPLPFADSPLANDPSPPGTNVSVAINPVTHRVYVADRGGLKMLVRQHTGEDCKISIFDGSKLPIKPLKTITTGIALNWIEANPNNNRIYVTNDYGNDTIIINGETNEVINSLPTGERPGCLAINPSNNDVYIVANSDSLVVIRQDAADTVVGCVEKTIPVINACNGVADDRESDARSREYANSVVIENRKYILDAARRFNVDPRVVAGGIWSEHARNLRDAETAQKVNSSAISLGHQFGQLRDPSIGVARVKLRTAKNLEDQGYMPSLADDDARTDALANPATNIMYAAAYIAYLGDKIYPTIKNVPSILIHKYNTGEFADRIFHSTIKPLNDPPGYYCFAREALQQFKYFESVGLKCGK